MPHSLKIGCHTMSEVTMKSDMTVRLIDSMASDLSVTRAAQVSVKGENNPDTDIPRLINYLMESRHGSPFEHSVFTWFVSAPIFVFREFHRHRIASYNEMSGRYTRLKPVFYTPSFERPLRNAGTSARPEFGFGEEDKELQALVWAGDRKQAELAWSLYIARLDKGVANEVARTVLPVSIYSEMYVTMNARALMNFLSLRVDSPDSTYRSRPQREIQMVAVEMEKDFHDLMPSTHDSFVKLGRVAP